MSAVNAPAIQNSAERLPARVAAAADGIRIPRATGGPVLNLYLMTIAEQISQEGEFVRRTQLPHPCKAWRFAHDPHGNEGR